jgi:transketolase C-terminal domain/subunit
LIFILKFNLKDAVSHALADQTEVRVYGVGIDSIVRSATPEELLDLFGLSANKIEHKVKSVLQSSHH